MGFKGPGFRGSAGRTSQSVKLRVGPRLTCAVPKPSKIASPPRRTVMEQTLGSQGSLSNYSMFRQAYTY